LAGVDHLADRYLNALEREIADSLNEPQEVDTIFVGGGTPTRLTASQLDRLTAIIRQWFVMAHGGEWTVEANPGTLDPEKCDVLAAAGVNRISLGAQSFRAESLKTLERNHGLADVERAVGLVRDRFPRWSLDLIFGVPNSTLDDWKHDLEVAIEMKPSHLSCYGLIFEKGTALWKQWRDGRVEPLDEETERAMYEHTIDGLATAGLEMYEISNYALPGEESRHNLVYWANDAYFGFGLGAARYLHGRRSVNTRDLMSYLNRIEAGEPTAGPTEQLDPEARARETAILMLRRTQLGLDRKDFTTRTGFDIDILAAPAIARYKVGDFLEDDGERLLLTRDGIFIADRILCEFL
jgi:oxygen-independent coproporphyrinogen-3 oxidase